MLLIFKEWGMPKAIRTDNGEPFGVPTRDVIPFMSLWIKAWGIDPILNRPKQPQDNAHVENNQATSSRWAEVFKCTSIEQMQRQLDEACHFQRDIYPVRRIGNASRKQVFPKLYDNPRLFEKVNFDEQRAYDFLAQVIYPRKVSARGTIALYNQPFQVGFKFRGQVLFVKLDPMKVKWLCLDENQNIVRILSDERLVKQNLYNLNICQRTL